VERLQELYRQNWCPQPKELGTFDAGNQEFSLGQAAMRISGHWPLPGLRKQLADDLVCLPMPRGSQRANILFWAGLGMVKESPLALEYLKAACSEQGSQAFGQWGLPAHGRVAERLRSERHERVFLDEMRHIVPRAYQKDPLWAEIGSAALVRLHEGAILHPQRPASQLLREAQQRVYEEVRLR